jgi:sigma-B regulation protein RsbU (phosphoserine phosphatase)
VFRSNDGGATLRGVATVGLPDELVDALSLSGAAFADVGGPRAVDRTWPGESARSLRRARAQVLVPIRGGDTLHGAIGVGGKMSGEGFMPADLAFLESVAAHVAVVLASLTLRARDAEVGSALEIQRHLLPTCITQPPGYSIAAEWRPARVVAGDSYDVIPLDGSRIGLCIADASGKGMPAALLMSNLQATLRSLAPGLTSPAALARRINDLLHGNVALGKYFTFFYAVLEPDEKLLRFVNAGHNPPILVRRHGGVERLREGGMALGLFEDREYREGRVQLEPGDIVLLFTDGVTEVENAAGEEFGEARLMEIARRQRGRPAATAVAEVLEEAVRFGGAGELGDDATLLVLAVDAED